MSQPGRNLRLWRHWTGANRSHSWKLLNLETGRYEGGTLVNEPEALQHGQPGSTSTSAAKFREFIHPSGSKSDHADTDILLALLQHHRDRLKPLRPDTAEARSLQILVEERRRLVDEKTRYSGLITAAAMIKVLRALNDSIEQLQHEIDELTATHSDRSLFVDLPGAGPVLLPRLLAAFGTDRQRWASAADLLSFSGVAPVMEQRGNSQWVHFRWKCPRFLRQNFVEFAGASRRRCVWAEAFYQSQISRGKRHNAAVRALAFKWVRILFRCWSDRIPYDETAYTEALARHHSPLATAVQSPGFTSMPQKKLDRTCSGDPTSSGRIAVYP